MVIVEQVQERLGQREDIEEMRWWKEGSEPTKSGVGVIGDFGQRFLAHNLSPFDADTLADVFAEIESRRASKLRAGDGVWFRILATISGQD